MAKNELPPSVGFSITQLIKGGWLDDILHVISMHINERKKEIERERRKLESGR